MLRLLKPALLTAALLFAVPAAADDPTAATGERYLSDAIGENGIQHTITRLSAMSRSPTPEQIFVLGGLRILGAIKAALQARWQVGIAESLAFLPVMRLTVPPNHAPLDPALVTTVFTAIAANMEDARNALRANAPDADFAVEIEIADV